MKHKECIDCEHRKSVITGYLSGYNDCDFRKICDGHTYYQKGTPQWIVLQGMEVRMMEVLDERIIDIQKDTEIAVEYGSSR